uniref:Resolvase/invertase-type recombinase catalytic domain-containing protein n=1 Tax=Candidatus Nitrotoga fabula TaxID=2182327 RepID=A0A2X0SJX5_9PROT|nr:protein of unknown function [Candidatus Nitrotoga fabula]
MLKNYVAYVRVSTTKQFIHGVSIAEQRRAITQYATLQQLNIIDWYEEIQSAARGRRPVFREMLKALKRHHYGLIMHKIDRGARNLRDWADIGDLIDEGIDVRFTFYFFGGVVWRGTDKKIERVFLWIGGSPP